MNRNARLHQLPPSRQSQQRQQAQQPHQQQQPHQSQHPQQPQPQYQQEHEAMLRAKRGQAEPAAAPVKAPAAPVKAAKAPVKAPAPVKAATKAKRARIPDAVPAAQTPLQDEQRELLRRYIEIDDQIADLVKRTKELRATKSQLESQVAGVLKPLAAPVQQGNAVLRIAVKNQKQGMTKPFLITKLKESGQLKDPEKSKEVIEGIYKSLGTTTKDEIVRK